MKSSNNEDVLNEKFIIIKKLMNENRQKLKLEISQDDKKLPRSMTMRLLAQTKIGQDISHNKWPHAAFRFLQITSKLLYKFRPNKPPRESGKP
ncbi:hypothetical protein R50072_21680 [Simiduia litorea]